MYIFASLSQKTVFPLCGLTSLHVLSRTLYVFGNFVLASTDLLNHGTVWYFSAQFFDCYIRIIMLLFRYESIVHLVHCILSISFIIGLHVRAVRQE